MKKIIYILDDGKRAFTYERLAGFIDAINNTEEPISLYIFRSAGFSGYEPMHNHGEYNIYRLPDLNDFDGIFLDISNVNKTNENLYGARGAAYITRAAAASCKPVVSIANRIADFYYVGIDNSAAMTSMISYLHEDLGLKDFWFLMGPADNYENMIRLEALKNYCRDHYLPRDDVRIHMESFAVESGINGFERLYYKHGGQLPQAVICANDWIAVGACRAAASHGIRIPGDILVTGFDDTDVSYYYTPSITTIDQYRWDMGKKCIDLMQRLWKGEKVDKTSYTNTRIVKRESTGELKAKEKSLEAQVVNSFNDKMYSETFNDRLYTLQYKLPGCGSLDEICQSLEPCIKETKCRGLWLVIDKELYDYGNRIDIDPESGSISDNSGLKTEGYPDTLEVIYSWTKKKGGSCPHEVIHGLFPFFDSHRPGNDYTFIPLHFMELTVGFLVINGVVDILHNGNIAPLVNTLTMAMRNYFDGKKLEYMNQMLSGMSMQDSLTGLNNRLGYHHLASGLFKETHEKDRKLGVLFIDMDKMKYFNDTFGHACGDDCLRALSDAIKDSISPDAVPVRFGGDEFLVLTPAAKASDMDKLVEAINSAIPSSSEKYKLPSLPGISTGYVITDPQSDLSLNEYVEEADRLMYNQKKAKKAGRK
ncbi:MAG: GGDEF domain-containing protein [Lachnospiraceae bacterium]|nr:GGDEF domain-containing protein [Lachnospiraceae bacterium]